MHDCACAFCLPHVPYYVSCPRSKFIGLGAVPRCMPSLDLPQWAAAAAFARDFTLRASRDLGPRTAPAAQHSCFCPAFEGPLELELCRQAQAHSYLGRGLVAFLSAETAWPRGDRPNASPQNCDPRTDAPSHPAATHTGKHQMHSCKE